MMAIATGAYSDFVIKEIRKTHTPAQVGLQKIRDNRLRVTFRRNGHELRFRLLMWAVSAASRADPLERRVEMTSTYEGGGLAPDPGYTDVVLGVLRKEEMLVGLDPRRLHKGGKSQNASTFVYLSSFEQLGVVGHLALPARQLMFPHEYQVYLRPAFLLDYLSDHAALHARGIWQSPSTSAPTALADQLDNFSARGSTRTLTYDQQVELALRKMQIGRAGESFVLAAEKRSLIKAGKAALAGKVDWVSQIKPYLGYDISSFHNNGATEYIEVKSSSGPLSRFYFTANEMKQAEKYGGSYRLVCVSNALGAPSSREFRNPVAHIAAGALEVLSDTSLVLVK